MAEGDFSAQDVEPLAISSKNVTIPLAEVKGVSDVRKICDLDIEIYRCVTPDIRTSEVIITDERIAHIRERHPDDYEQYSQYLSEIIGGPDYILEANKPNTAFLLKEIKMGDGYYQLILRLAIVDDLPEYKNSIITFLKIDKKRYERYLRTKKILYRRE